MTQKNMANRFKGDVIVWIAIIALCCYSVLAVYSGIAKKAPSGENIQLLKHVFIIAVGLGFMYLVHLVKWHNALQKLSLSLLIVSWILLIITLLFGKEVNAAKRWLDLYIFSVQTSDIAKLMLIVYLSTILSNMKRYDKIFDAKQKLKNKTLQLILQPMIIWVCVPIAITCGLIAIADNSTAMILFAIAILMMFFARVSIGKILLLAGVCVLGVFLLLSLGSGNRLKTGKGRWHNFIERNDNPHSQEFKAKLAVAEGGIIRISPGKSEQRFKLPNIESDYIFAIIVEEYGLLLGAVPIIGLFLILTFRGVRIALNSSRKFSAYLVLGITFVYVLQAFINIGVSVDLLPVTGQPMPFVSKGGSMFIVCCVAFGLVLSESRVNDEERIAKEMAEIKETKEEEEI
ncbi:MAG: FtsW/RodA/SpoVE family cell cycle protein [Bacteroidales bacterium]|nr:FtsW/RodA/SpoVE family cell cycle protein [Bacteroidales bacterium]